MSRLLNRLALGFHGSLISLENDILSSSRVFSSLLSSSSASSWAGPAQTNRRPFSADPTSSSSGPLSSPSILSPEREELLKRILGDSCMGGRELRKKNLNEFSEKFKLHERDCGSPEYQIARLTSDLALYDKLLAGPQRKNYRLKAHRQQMMYRRAKYLRYLRTLDFERYYGTITALGLPDEHAPVSYHQRYVPRVRWEVVEAGLKEGLSKEQILARVEEAEREDRKKLQAKGLHPIPPSVPRSRSGFAPRRPPPKKGRGRI